MLAWTISLGFNNLEAPFDDPEIRRAIGFAIDREQLVKIVVDVSDIFQDLIPVLIAQLQRAGFDANFRMTADSYMQNSPGACAGFHDGAVGLRA